MGDFDKTQNICRICLGQNNEQIKCVFDTIKCAGESKQLSEMLMEFAKVEIILGDELPDQICFNCTQNTIKFYLFKIKCEDTDKTLRKHLEEDSFIVIDKIKIDEEDILDKLKSDIKSDNVVEADDVLKDNSGLIENNHLVTIVYEDNNACVSPKHNEFVITVNNKITTNTTLSIAEESFESQENNALLHRQKVAEIAHKIKMIDQTLDCEEHKINCKQKDKKLRGTSKKNLYKCDNCKMTFSRSASLAGHKCTMYYTEKEQTNSLINHKRLNADEKSYECDVCEKKFTALSTYYYHKRTHTGKKPFKCNVCKKKFIQSCHLTAHKRIHTGEKPYKCDVCDKTFIQQSGLTVHKRRHTDKKSYDLRFPCL